MLLKGSDSMIKKLFAVLLALFLTADFFTCSVFAAEITANKVDFIGSQNNNSDSINHTVTSNNIYIASNIQPDLNVFIESILKVIYKIVPIQLADGTLKVSEKELEARKAVLKKKIKFENDIRLFTLYAFMNYTGYNGDCNSSEFSDIRNRVMEDLNKLNLKLSDNKYYSNKNVQFSYYKNALRNMGSTPNFNIIGHKGNILNSLSDLDESLKEFYLKADIRNLYNKYKPYYNAELKKIEDKSLTALVVINNFLKIDNEDIPNINVELNLLEAYDKNTGFTLIDLYTGNAVITLGPSKDQYVQSVVHEYLHCLINPIVDNLQDEVNKLSYKAKEVPDDSQAKLYYKEWAVNVEESIVKAIEYRAIGGNGKASIQNAMDDGFILTQYFDEEFDRYKDYNGSLNDFIKSLLQNYNKNKK